MLILQKIDVDSFSTIGDAVFYGHTRGLYFHKYKLLHQEEVFYLKLSRMIINDLGKLGLAGKCLKQALLFSMDNERKSCVEGGFKNVTRPEKIYRQLVHLYVDMGAFPHLKKLRKLYEKGYKNFHELQFRKKVEEDFNKRKRIDQRSIEILGLKQYEIDDYYVWCGLDV